MEKIKGLKKYKLELVVFVCGAMTMVLELVAARVLSPYVGSSNLIWTSIIGIMLVFMSLGYWAGGKIADKKHDINDLSQFILISAITTSIIPILETIIVNNLAQVIEQLIIVAIISAIFIFGIPSFMLATASPIAVKLKNEEEKKVGSVSGKISSLSTIGSIFGTFFAGFVLIPNVGVSNIIIGSSILLLMLSILIHPKKDKKYVISMIIVTLVIILLCLTGKNLFKMAASQFEYFACDIQNCLQPTLIRPSNMSPRRQEFWEDIYQMPFDRVIKKYTKPVSWKKRIKRNLKKIFYVVGIRKHP